MKKIRKILVALALAVPTMMPNYATAEDVTNVDNEILSSLNVDKKKKWGKGKVTCQGQTTIITLYKDDNDLIIELYNKTTGDKEEIVIYNYFG